mgnify:CR=1 FL=1|jgi:hypothetical protein
MIKFEDMLNDLLPDVPGCQNDLAINALRNAAIELYTKSWIYTQACDSQQTVIGQAEYDLDTFNQYKLIGIVSASIDDANILPVGKTSLNRSNLRWQDDTGQPTNYFSYDYTTLRLYPIPDRVSTLNVTVALTPAKTATGIENFIYDLYSEQLAAGAKARLMLIPNKPFTDVNASREYRAQFSAAITDAKWRAHKSLTNAQLQAAPLIVIRRS